LSKLQQPKSKLELHLLPWA